MPPVTKAGGTKFRKDVEFAATKDSDEYELEASGIVMVPDKADLQNDFAREETIREFADQFAAFEEANQAGGGIMHAVWPDGWMELTRNEVLDEAEEIGGQTVGAGAWVQTWGVTEEKLAGLIDENILEGYSIGAIQVDWDGPYDPEEVDDVDTSEVPDDEAVWELIAGIIREVSAVDIPAVPDAEILEAKGLDKRLAEHVGNPDAFLEEAMERGHSEDEAEQLWDALSDAMEADGAAEPGKQSLFHRAGQTFFQTFTGTDDDTDVKTSEAPGQNKEGRTLSTSNRHSLYATIDASLDILQDAGVDHGMTRFTDSEDTTFDLSEHDAREWADDDDDGEDEGGEEEEEENGKDAPAGDTADETTDMSNDDPDDEGDTKSLAEKNAEQITELTDAVETLTRTLTGEEKTREIELDGETVEVSEEELRSALGVGDGATEDVDELQSDVQDLAARIDTIAEQGGVSTQLDAGTESSEGDEDELKGLGAALS